MNLNHYGMANCHLTNTVLQIILVSTKTTWLRESDMRFPIQLLTMAAAVLLSSTSLSEAQSDKPIKIGHLVPLTGPLASVGAGTKAGAEIAFEEINYRISGRPIVLTYEDEAFKADIALTKAKKLIERDDVSILIGPTGAHQCLALRNFITEKRIPWIATQCVGKDLSPPRTASPVFFRVSQQYDQLHPVMAKYVFEKLGYKKIVAFGLDYAAGHDETNAFTKAFKEAGGEVVNTIYIPIGAQDSAPYTTMAASASADAMFINLWGIDAARFIKTAAEFGLMKRVPFFANGTAVDDADTLPAAGDSAIGILNYRSYSAQHDTKANKEFVSRVRAKTGAVPNQYVYSGYLAASAVIKALEKIGGNVEDKNAFLEALRTVEFEAPGGTFRFDANNQAIQTLFIRKVVRGKEGLSNEEVDVIRDVAASR